MKKLDVVFSADNNYIQHFTVACTSLLEHNRNIVGKVMLISDSSKLPLLEKVKSYFLKRYEIRLDLYRPDVSKLEACKVSHHISKAAYYRILLPDLLPTTLNTVLYLDSDLIVQGDLSELLEIEFNNLVKNIKKDMNVGHALDTIDCKEYYLYAVNHKFTDQDLNLFNSAFHESAVVKKYFNSGVMLLNLRKWREDNCTEKLLYLASKYYDVLKWYDQDLLNIAFSGSWGEMGSEFNVIEKNPSLSNQNKIVHFISADKPWHYSNKHPYKNLYWKYRKMSPFKHCSVKDYTLKVLLKSVVPVKARRAYRSLVER